MALRAELMAVKAENAALRAENARLTALATEWDDGVVAMASPAAP